eukprot:282501-Pelagomonas_calceolata.AAC.4
MPVGVMESMTQQGAGLTCSRAGFFDGANARPGLSSSHGRGVEWPALVRQAYFFWLPCVGGFLHTQPLHYTPTELGSPGNKLSLAFKLTFRAVVGRANCLWQLHQSSSGSIPHACHTIKTIETHW